MKDTLVQYKGGGYSGCFWEWNYGVFDDDGEFHVIFASGSKGCETAEEMREHITQEEDPIARYKVNHHA